MYSHYFYCGMLVADKAVEWVIAPIMDHLMADSVIVNQHFSPT